MKPKSRASGAKEIVLTGVDLTSWGHDLRDAPGLGALVTAILREFPQMPRLRLSSVDGVEIDEALFDLIAHEPRVMPQRLNGTNRLELSVHGNRDNGAVALVAVLDNLGKGASGAAVQNLNIMLGLDEGAGLETDAAQAAE